MKTTLLTACAFLTCMGLACNKKTDGDPGFARKAADGSPTGKVGGQVIKIDGSSTVFPITQAVAEEFQHELGGRVTIGVSGTGGGFKKFCRAETALTGASRPIKPTEVEQCQTNSVKWVELPVAYDGIAVVIHPKNTWAKTMTVTDLKKIWAPEADRKIMRWNQVRPEWPDKPIHLFGPGVDSGTYDYFTKAIVGKEHASRADFTSSEDDNVLVKGVAMDTAALGFFGYAYYIENKDKLALVAVDDGNQENGAGPIKPSVKTVADGTYQPLSRPVFVYVSKAAARRPEVEAFVRYFLTSGRDLVKEVGYIPLPGGIYDMVGKRFEKRTLGSLFEGGSEVGVTLEELLGDS